MAVLANIRYEFAQRSINQIIAYTQFGKIYFPNYPLEDVVRSEESYLMRCFTRVFYENYYFCFDKFESRKNNVLDLNLTRSGRRVNSNILKTNSYET